LNSIAQLHKKTVGATGSSNRLFKRLTETIEKKMKLENRKQRLAPFNEFILRIVRYSLFAFVLVLISVLIGVIGYSYYGRLNMVDSFYMSCMILTGMGPVVELTTREAKLFSSFYALYSGVAFLSITAVFFAPIIHRLLHIFHLEDIVNEK
jgi:hypothetical protein